MAIHGNPGGFVTAAAPTVTTSGAKGIWTKAKQLVYQAAGSWPVVPNNTVAPAVTGTAMTGQTLSCTTGTWTGAGITYSYQWQHTTTNISAATSSTYVIDAAYVGETIRCVVTATTAASAISANSNATSVVVTNVVSSVEYLVVAGGGGGGGQYYGGGGGAGGYRTASGYAVVTSTAYTVTIGSGGVGGYAYAQGANGGVSSWNTNAVGSGAKIESAGGGGGGSYQGGGTLVSGGSGGGADPSPSQGQTYGLGNTPSTSPVQGYDGGDAVYSDDFEWYSGGGGGGASAVGGGGRANGGAGGTGSSFAGTYYSGGGGGGSNGTPGAGGTGGGASGVSSGSGNSAAGNTGGGGGGGNTVSYGNPTGGAGGSGIVIVRYADSFAAATSTTGSPTITVAGGYRVYKWTGSGSITI